MFFSFDEPIGKLADAEFVKDGDSREFRGKGYQPIGIMINGLGYPELKPFSSDLANHVYQYRWMGKVRGLGLQSKMTTTATTLESSQPESCSCHSPLRSGIGLSANGSCG